MPKRVTMGLVTASALLAAGWARGDDPKPKGQPDDGKPKAEAGADAGAGAGDVGEDPADAKAPKAKAGARAAAKPKAEAIPEAEEGGRVEHTEAEWRRLLTPAQYYVVRMKGTEQPWSGKYSRGTHHGTFACVGCGAELFSSDHKFQSGTGWPSFWRPIVAARLTTAPDFSNGEPRIEVECSRCGAHLGHVFDDGPPPTGLRFCINSASLKLKPPAKAKAAAKGKAAAKSRGEAKAAGEGSAEGEAEGGETPPPDGEADRPAADAAKGAGGS
jgi:peptide-methionine (R)-S-oxide reductase